MFFNFVMAVFGMIGASIALIPGVGESMGASTDMLVNAPFATFLVPGLFLLLVIGGGNLAAALLLARSKPQGVYLSLGMGLVTMLWILIQCYMLWAVAVIHPIFLLIGLIQGGFAYYLIRKHQIPVPFAAVVR